jgi:large subunit ribosomal protein L28e
MSNVSSDLIWEVSRKWFWVRLRNLWPGADEFLCAGSQNAYLVKRKSGAAPQFSRDPLNLTNVHARKVRLDNHQRRGRNG